MHRQAVRLGGFLQGINPPAGGSRGAEHANDVLAAVQQRFQDAFAEGLLAVDNDSHVIFSY